MIRSRRTSTLLVWILAAVLSQQAAAQPSHETPDGPLAVRPGKEAEQLVRAAVKLYDDTKTAVGVILQRQEQGRLRQVKMAAIGEACLEAKRLGRLARALTFLGEPAGVDFRLRAEALRAELEVVMDAYKEQPAIADLLKRAREGLTHEGTKKAAILLKVDRLKEAGKWEQAEAEILQVLDSMEARTVWYVPSTRRAMIGRFDVPLVTVSEKSSKVQQARTEQALAQARRQEVPDFDGLLGRLRQATAAVRSGGKASVGGKPLAGPQVIEEFGRQWQAAQLAAIRCRALDWARGDSGRQELGELAAAQARFSRDMVSALVAVIEADTARASADEVRPLYEAYLAALAPQVALGADDTLAEAARPALEKLAVKSPALAAEVAAYRAATSVLLGWRRRVAEARAAAQMGQYSPLEKEFRDAVAGDRPSPGLVSTNSANTKQAMLRSPAPVVMQSAVPKLMGRRVCLVDVVGLPVSTKTASNFTSSKKMAASRYRERTYALIALPLSYEAGVAVLERDLMVTASSPPLTLEAAVAVASARRGDLAAAGGEITGVYLESVINRFATLTPAGGVLLPLGPLEAEPTRGMIAQVLMRFDVKPAWAQNAYFFVELR